MNWTATRRTALRVILLLLALLIAWRILSNGLGEHFTRQALLGDEQAVGKALLWNPEQPTALYLRAESLMQSEPAQAEALLRKSIRLNPGNAVPMEMLARLLFDRHQIEAADEMIDLAVRRMPARKDIQLSAARYWVKRGQLSRAMENWAAVLRLDPGMGEKIYPTLTQIAENSQSVGLFKSLAESPPNWWDDFFIYLSEHAKKLETVVTVASIRHASKITLSRVERDELVKRLQEDHQWPEAYLVWVNGLDSEERRYLGSVFDGGFELAPANTGFGWYFPENKAWLIRRKNTYGAEGEKALHIFYKGENTPVNQVYQPLLLSPGHYVMNMRTRVDRLRVQGGIRWMLRCLGDESRVLGMGPLLVGASDWETHQFSFEVPNDKACTGQLLRLEIVGEDTDDRIVEGEVWFDRLSIRKIEHEQH
ncbi:MAG TPA: hypothetical protein ENJ12_04930 [Thiolapillus brandeum]|uniref:Tetratricopeptide repeat protein n=1 Tax=Thiolapillus brandeum TaxID=1076588 RepID=A0A831WBA9_9GAMM|nr:hypothetical protein [Thiolapillus brandeum]